MELHGKVAVITGAAQGLGKSYMQALLERGAKVSFCDVNRVQGQQTARVFGEEFGKENVLFSYCDVRKLPDLKEVFQKTKEQFGRIDIMVNNAGICNEVEWEKSIDINLKGLIYGTNMALEYMRKDKGGKGGVIVNVASLYGIIPTAFAAVYSATKSGVIGYTRSWARHPDVEINGVRMVCLCPNLADTAILTSGKVISKSHSKIFLEYVDKFSIMSQNKVVRAFMKLLDDIDNNGSVLTVDQKLGTEYMYYTDPANRAVAAMDLEKYASSKL